MSRTIVIAIFFVAYILQSPNETPFEHYMSSCATHVELNFNPFNHVQDVFPGDFCG